MELQEQLQHVITYLPLDAKEKDLHDIYQVMKDEPRGEFVIHFDSEHSLDGSQRAVITISKYISLPSGILAVGENAKLQHLELDRKDVRKLLLFFQDPEDPLEWSKQFNYKDKDSADELMKRIVALVDVDYCVYPGKGRSRFIKEEDDIPPKST